MILIIIIRIKINYNQTNLQTINEISNFLLDCLKKVKNRLEFIINYFK